MTDATFLHADVEEDRLDHRMRLNLSAKALVSGISDAINEQGEWVAERVAKAQEDEEYGGKKVAHAVFGGGANIASAHEFVSSISDEETVLKEGVLSKRVVSKDVTWKERYTTLTEERLNCRNEERECVYYTYVYVCVHVSPNTHTQTLLYVHTQGKIYFRNEERGGIKDTLDLLKITHVRAMIKESHSFLSLSHSFLSGLDAAVGTPAVASPPSPQADIAGGDRGESQTSPQQESVSNAENHLEGAEGQSQRGSRKSIFQLDPVTAIASAASSPDTDTRKGNHRAVTLMGPTQSSVQGGSQYAAEWKNVFEIYEECYGRTYYLRTGTHEECTAWVNDINAAVAAARAAHDKRQLVRKRDRLRRAARDLYDGPVMQTLVAMLLIANFVISIIQGEMLSRVHEAAGGDDAESAAQVAADKALVEKIDVVEMVFAFVFLGELLLNMYGHWFWPFFSSRWSWFDMIVVFMSVVDAVYVLAGGSGNGLAVMRLLRIFRIVRIANRLENLRNILQANLCAMGPVSNAFLLFIVTVAIYSVIAVNLFSQQGAESDTEGEGGIGSGGSCQENRACFKSFSMSFYTLLGVATGENWTPYIHAMTTPEGHIDTSVSIFFLSFTALVGIVAINIIVAVLLENFVSSMTRHTTLKRIREEARDHHKCAGALDPLMVRHCWSPLQRCCLIIVRRRDACERERETLRERERERERLCVCVCTGNAGELPVPLAL